MEQSKEILSENLPSIKLSIDELFLDSDEFGSYFSPEIATPEIVRQIESHAAETKNLNEIIDAVEESGKNTYSLIDSGIISHEKAELFFESLARKLEDKLGWRLLLYLPFETYPRSDWLSGDQNLDESVNFFRGEAKNAWFELLSQADVRANFVDGDVLEERLRKEKPERIVKAVHLAPILVIQGVISKEDVLREAEASKKYSVLAQSFSGALDVMLDLGIISQEERDGVDIEYVSKIKDDGIETSEARASWLANRQNEGALIFNDSNRPLLHGKLSDNLLEINQTVAELEQIVESEEVSRIIHPVAILAGSRLKGYGAIQSDLDVSVFVRPNIDFNQESRALLEKAFGFNPNVFLLEELNGSIKIDDTKSEKSHVGNSSWVHVLFGGVWIGKNDSVKNLQAELLPSYFNEENQATYMQYMENDALRYRLLHKGFSRHYEIKSIIANLPHADEVDGKSAFYDEAYRRLATRLFFERVFLPKK